MRKHDCARHHRARQRAATRLVNAGDQRRALLPKLALKAEPVPLRGGLCHNYFRFCTNLSSGPTEAN